MDPNEMETAPEAEANTALSPSATDGASSSDAADQAPESAAEAILREFQEEYGDDEPGVDPDEPEGDEAQESAEDDPEPAEAAQTPEEDQTDDGDSDEFRIPDDQFKALPSGVKKRLGHLNTRAKKAERELDALQQQMEPLQDAHQRFTQLQNYVQEHDIQPENVTLAFNAMAAMSRGDHEAFIKMVQPWLDQAQQASGQAIAPDLRQQVEDGYLSEEHARELTKSRLQSQISQGKVDALTAKQQQQQKAQQQTHTQSQIVTAIQAREAELQSSDPDYAQKAAAMQSMVQFALESGSRPTNVEQALNLVNNAYDRVNQTFKKPVPPKPTMPRPTASSSPQGNPPPETTKDAIFQGLRGMPNA